MDKKAQQEETSIIPTMQQAISIPMMDLEELKKLTAYVNEVKKVLMKEGKDYVIDGEKQYTVRSGFAKLAQGFNLSDDLPIIKTLRYDEPRTWKFDYYIKREKKDGVVTTDLNGFEAIVVVRNVYGRQASGEGACTIEELHMTNNMSPKWYHRCLATAKTRAYNRAVSNFVGSADVSAEEMGLVYDTEGERKDVESEQRDSFPLPEAFKLPEWDFTEALRGEGWAKLDEAFGAFIGDAGLDQKMFELEKEDLRAIIRCKPYLGDSFGDIARLLAKAGFNWRAQESRFVLMKPEGVK